MLQHLARPRDRLDLEIMSALVGQVWSSAVGVFVHTVTTANQLQRAEASVRALAGSDPAS